MGLTLSGGTAVALHTGLAARRRMPEQIAPFRINVRERCAPMPAWLELLLNVIAFAGFIGIAKYHKSRGAKLPD